MDYSISKAIPSPSVCVIKIAEWWFLKILSSHNPCV